VVKMEVTEEAVREALKSVIDPELGLSVVDLGLIYRLEVKEDNIVEVDMTLTFPGCPLAARIVADVERTILSVPGVKDAIVNLVFDPPWTPAMLSDEAKKLLSMGD